MTRLTAPPEARPVADTWAELAAGTRSPEPFDPAVLADLPEPLRRWLSRGIVPGTPLRTTAVLTTSGRIRVGSRRPFRATQVIAARTGYVWAATARMGPVPVRGFDLYHRGAGRMRWRLAGLVPVMSAEGSDVALSAAGRLAGELVMTPAAALSPRVAWEQVDRNTVRAHLDVDGRSHELTVGVGDRGELARVGLPRWGDPDGTGYGQHRFEARFSGERGFGGFTLPHRVRAGWGLEPDDGDRAFIDYAVDSATWL